MSDPTSLPSFPPPAQEHPLRDRIVAALHDDGLHTEIDPDGDIAVKVNGQHLFVRCFEGEVPLMRVFGQWQIDESLEKDETFRLQKCNEVGMNLNLVQIGLAGDSVLVSAEQIVPEGVDAKMLTSILISVVLQGVQIWHEVMQGRYPGAEPAQA